MMDSNSEYIESRQIKVWRRYQGKRFDLVVDYFTLPNIPNRLQSGISIPGSFKRPV